MTEGQKKAVSMFKEGHSCSQSIFAAFAPQLGLDEKTALKIACPFGGGMARMGDTCGAVTGAFMVIGLKHGRVDPEDEAAKEKTYALINRFVERFKSRNTHIACRDLLGYNIGNPKEHEIIEEKGLFDTLCPRLVQDATEILDELIQ